MAIKNLQKVNRGYAVLFVLVIIALFFYLFRFKTPDETSTEWKPDVVQAEEKKLTRLELKQARNDYFLRMLRDPATGKIPPDIREKELNFAKGVLPASRFKGSVFVTTASIETLPWKEIGPNNVGGRTRALAVDADNPDIIIAGGVSGGIWKSTDGGASWNSKSTTNDRLSVTWLVQDTTSADNDTWYYATGEYQGNSASETGAGFHGYGVFKSTDNGENWSRIPSTADDDTIFDSPYDFISRLIINPATGTLFMASNGFGIYCLNENTLVLGGPGEHAFSDIAANRDGELLAVTSQLTAGATSNNPGLFISINDGQSWSEITPASFPDQHERSFISFAPSAPDTAYIITYTGLSATATPNDSVKFHMIELDAPGDTVLTEDRSANLPDFGDPVGEIAQSNYDMVLAVKPDDPDFVLLGFTNLYRSRDGFKTPADDANDHWIGGYATANDVSEYMNHHPDQHVLFFDYSNPDKLWSGHDGGISLTTDISVSDAVAWQDMNNGYNVTQFYDVSIPDESGDHRIMGGTQDNGTPLFTTEVDGNSLGDASSGDGGFSYFGDNFLFNSSQNGVVRRYTYSAGGIGGQFADNVTGAAFIYPPGRTGQLFINPFAIDPNDETIIYYPSGEHLWRNTDIEDDAIDPGNGNFFIDGWEQLTNLSPPSGSTISAIAVSRSDPDHRLYYAAYRSGSAPLIYRIDDAHTATNSVDNLKDISISGAPGGAYIHNLAINPEDAGELIAVMSNYNIVGLYHTTDGGSSWTGIEGNLTGDAGNPGPSMRDAAIIPLATETFYMVATSTGVYSTRNLNGASTIWSQEGSSVIGNAVSTSLAHRASDNTLVVGTHGRGIFGKIPKEREIAGNAGWRMMSAPVENMPISEITDDTPIQGFGDGFDINFYTGYDGSGFTAPAGLNGNLSSGKGFIIYMFDNSQAGSNPLPHPISADGSEPAGDVTVNLHTSGNRYNLVGNPYNAPIDFDKVILDEVEAKWWVWNDATSQYYTYNGVTGVTTEPDNDGHIAPWQGFFVIAQAGASSPSITFSQDDKAHYHTRFYRDGKKQNVRTIRFTVRGQNLIDDNTVAVFYGGGTKELDPGDMEELGPLANDFVSLSFSVETDRGSISLANDARPADIDISEIFQIKMKTSKPGTYTLNWVTQNIPDDWVFELYDRHTGAILYLNGMDRYQFEVKNREKTAGSTGPSISGPAVSGSSRFEFIVREGADRVIDNIPNQFSLNQNYPNPFNPLTTIRYQVPQTVKVRLEVFNVIGQKIVVLVNETKEPGYYRTDFNASRLSSGIYFYRLRAGDYVKTHSMTLIK